MTDIQNQDINELVSAWQEYFKTIDNWQELIEGIEPKATGCGPVYELDNKLDRVNESLAIADMRDIEYATPHYHTNDETEIYFVLNGSGLVVIGNGEKRVEKDDVIVIPPDTAHYTIPDKGQGLVLAVVNTPPFNPANAVDITEDSPQFAFDLHKFQQLTNKNDQEATR